MAKVSIIIPTYNHLEDCLKPCIESIKKYTTLEHEIIVVANGCIDGTEAYAEAQGCRVISMPNPAGFAKAVNMGLNIAQCEYIVILNNDTVLRQQEPNKWLNLLMEPFLKDPTVGVTGPLKGTVLNRDFMIFFCVMISRNTLNTVGFLDEQFGVGSCEDMDFCLRSQDKGLRIVQVPEGEILKKGEKFMEGSFPIHHKAEQTVHENPDWSNIFKNNLVKLNDKHNKYISVVICTRNRQEVLSLVLTAVINQTYKPYEVLIYDDGKHTDLRNVAPYDNLFVLLERKNIKWRVLFSDDKGQAFNHRRSYNDAVGAFIWRLDDDTIPDSDVLEKLVRCMDDEKVGAVGGLVLDPRVIGKSELASNKIEDIYLGLNEQWFQSNKPISEVDHLYSTFLYRKKAVKPEYYHKLSRIGHREETTLSYSIKRAGWKVLFNSTAVTWHLRSTTGGIRDGVREMWELDELKFQGFLQECGVKPTPWKMIAMDNGIGDHYSFKRILPEVKAKYGKYLIVAAAYPEVFWDVKDVKVVSIGEAVLSGSLNNVYRFMIENNWKCTLEEAFRRLYL